MMVYFQTQENTVTQDRSQRWARMRDILGLNIKLGKNTVITY